MSREGLLCRLCDLASLTLKVQDQRIATLSEAASFVEGITLIAYRTSGLSDRRTEFLRPKNSAISAALRQRSNSGSDYAGFLVIRNGHHRRDACLFSIDIQFPKLDVAGSIPVSRVSDRTDL